MHLIRFVLALLCVMIVNRAGAQWPASGREAGATAFDLQDRRARELLYVAQCAGYVGSLRAQGRFGPADSIGNSGFCIDFQGQRLGGFLQTDSAITRIERLAAVSLASGARYTGPLDTASLLARERADVDGQTRGYATFAKLDRQFSPWTMTSRGDSLSAWLIPHAVLMGSALGGELGFLYSSDGRTMVKEINASSAFRPFAIPDTGTVTIRSGEVELPLVSELLIANALNARGRSVTIVTTKFASTLAGRGASAMWVHVLRK
jgi:hypothetical protein